MSQVRAIFVNSGMLGHASVASLIADAIARDPQIHATHISLTDPLNRRERLIRAALCARPLGRTNLDLARWRSEWHSGLLAAKRLRQTLAQRGPADVLHFHTQATAYASLGLMAATPSIVSIDITQPLASLEAPEALRVTYQPNVLHDGAVFRRAAAIVATSRWAAESLARAYPDCARRVTVQPYPVRLDQTNREWLDVRRRRAADAPVRFLFIGGDFVRKGGPDLLHAWQDGAFGSAHRLTIVTDWPLDNRRLPAGVEIARGVRPYTQAWRDLWRDADIFVMPARAEAFGMVYQEAAAAGLPAIGPRINAVPEIINDGVTGLLLPPGDACALAEAMRALAVSPDLRHALGRAARDRMEACGTLDRYGQVLAALVHDVARRSQGRTLGVATPGRQPSALERSGRVLAAPLRQGPVRSAAARLLETALNLGSAGRGLKCRLPGGEVVRVLPKYRSASWNLDEYRAFRSVVGPGAVVLDVGASVGSYSLLFGQWAGCGGRVYAFEPAPEIRAVLERHVTLNALDGIVVPVAAAASDANGRSTFVTPGPHGISRLAATGESSPLTVDTITIDEFCRRESVKPDLIKIDVEGAELAVLRGARDTLRACRRNVAVFVELHPTLWPVIGVTREQIEAELDSLGLHIEANGHGGNPWSLEGVALRLRPS
jgi:FkbM family methyltransferase